MALLFELMISMQLVFDADGVTPSLMFMGGSFQEYNQGITSLERTFVFEFN